MTGTRTFSVASVGVADMKIEDFSQKVTECTPSTVFNSDNYIATYNIANRGTASEKSYIKELYRTAGETNWHELGVGETDLEIAPGNKAGVRFPAVNNWTCPASGVTTEFAIKVWGKTTESEFYGVSWDESADTYSRI